jgi:hypothetical protein
MRLSPLALLLIGCGAVYFTEPNHPVLFRSKAQYSTATVAEPVVWMPILDLFAENGGSCPDARAWTLATINAAIVGAGGSGLELAGADLSPTCAQQPDRTLDLPSLRQQIATAVAQFPAAHVRAVIVYANDIALPIPNQVLDALLSLRSQGFLWTLALAPVTGQLTPDQQVPWTYTYDPALAQQLAQVATAQLPLQSDANSDSGFLPILGSGDLPRARETKLCSASAGVIVAGIPADGSSAPVDAHAPPLFEARFAQQVAVPRSQSSIQHAEVEVESCAANCDRYFSASLDDLRRWNTTRGCLLEGP